jgi:hypothetical protein
VSSSMARAATSGARARQAGVLNVGCTYRLHDYWTRLLFQLELSASFPCRAG